MEKDESLEGRRPQTQQDLARAALSGAIQVIISMPMGSSIKLIGKGQNTKQVYKPILTPDQLALLESTPDTEPFDGRKTTDQHSRCVPNSSPSTALPGPAKSPTRNG